MICAGSTRRSRGGDGRRGVRLESTLALMVVMMMMMVMVAVAVVIVVLMEFVVVLIVLPGTRRGSEGVSILDDAGARQVRLASGRRSENFFTDHRAAIRQNEALRLSLEHRWVARIVRMVQRANYSVVVAARTIRHGYGQVLATADGLTIEAGLFSRVSSVERHRVGSSISYRRFVREGAARLFHHRRSGGLRPIEDQSRRHGVGSADFGNPR